MKAQKYYDRDKLTYEEKVTICNKSDNRCCHCGKKAFINYEATIDHFIPLDKGGSNNTINLIMLCYDCNQEKDNKIMTIDYVPYLKEPHKERLDQYINSYVQVMDLAERNRLLAYDEYDRNIKHAIRGHKNKLREVSVTKYKLKLATWNDLDKIHEYFVKYLKKNDSLDDADAARENVIFWMQFGSIYYVEKNNEINMMIAITIKYVADGEDFRGCNCLPNMYIFPYYDTPISEVIVEDLISMIPTYILQESNINFVPFNVLMLNKDKMTETIATNHNNSIEDNVHGFTRMPYLAGDVEQTNKTLTLSEMNESELKTYNFFKKFDDITDSMIDYFEKYSDRQEISWMINSVFSYERIKNTKLMEIYGRTLEVYTEGD